MDFSEWSMKNEDKTLMDLVKEKFGEAAYPERFDTIQNAEEVVGLYFARTGTPEYYVYSKLSKSDPTRYYVYVQGNTCNDTDDIERRLLG